MDGRTPSAGAVGGPSSGQAGGPISLSPGQRRLSSKAPRGWVPRACDRCRKRKARCDEAVPCRNCRESGADCTHDAPVLKRGPRARAPPQDLESRLRNLEHLIASIPGGSANASTSLSLGELDQIRSAAHVTPGSEASPPAAGDAGGNGSGGAAGAAGMQSMHAGWQASAAPHGFGIAPAATPATHHNIGMGKMEGVEPGPSNYGHFGGESAQLYAQPQQHHQQHQHDQHRGSAHAHPGGDLAMLLNGNPAGHQPYAPAPSQQHLAQGHGSDGPQSSQDLLYRDADGQTKWLGPSSGMPLLDLLKTNHANSPPLVPGGISLAEEWISLSVAIGIQDGTNASAGQREGREGERAGGGEGGEENAEFAHLWGRVLECCPQDLMDSLVRAYFTISHLLWPILHAPTFMAAYNDERCRRNPSFVALVLSVCCLSSRYTQDARLQAVGSDGLTVAQRLLQLAKHTLSNEAAERADLEVVQALFNLSVVQEGTARPNLLWSYLCQALSLAIDMGLHRRVDEWESFSAVDIEVRKRTLWALYSQNIKASCTFGRPPMLRLSDLDIDEPVAVDDAYISAEQGIGSQPPDRPSVMAGFVAAVRLHMVLERTIRKINRVKQPWAHNSPFRALVGTSQPDDKDTSDETQLLFQVTADIPGDWTYHPTTVADPDNVRFFQKTRIFTLQHFIRLLSARHRFEGVLADLTAARNRSPTENWHAPHPDEQATLQQIAQSALGIIGTYSAIHSRGRLGFFGAHAIAQLTQAGAGLIGVILHLRTPGNHGNEQLLGLAMQGLPADIQILMHLGKRRPAGLRSAELLVEFSKACRIPVFVPSTNMNAHNGSEHEAGTSGSNPSHRPVEVPMLRALPRRSTAPYRPEEHAQGDADALFDEWLQIASRSHWNPDGVVG